MSPININAINWYAGARSRIDRLQPHGSGMNLWGSAGSYLSNSAAAATEFGPYVTRFRVESQNTLFTDASAPVELVKEALQWARVPFMVAAVTPHDTYGELISLLGDYTGGDRKHAIDWLRGRLGFDSILTCEVTGRRDGRDFSEGDVLVVLDPGIATAEEVVASPEQLDSAGAGSVLDNLDLDDLDEVLGKSPHRGPSMGL